MTTEEAIKTIEVAIGEIEWNYPMNYSEAFEVALAALRAQQEAERNEPLTLEQLLEMNGEPVWYLLKDARQGYGFVLASESEDIAYVVGLNGFLVALYVRGEHDDRLGAKLYRHKPREGTR